MKLFCLPYAGGSAMIYKNKNWERYLDDSIELVPIELAGRGIRYSEKLYGNFNEAVDDIYNLIKGDLDKTDYAIYGHSMGSLLAYELYYKIKQLKNKSSPRHMFFSGIQPPHLKINHKMIHHLPDKEFEEEIIGLGGTPKEIFENKEVFKFFLPTLRADFKIIEKYNYVEKRDKIDCAITILIGREDKLTKSNIVEWKIQTQSDCNIYSFQGDHFFINSNVERITDIINNTLVKS
jgi:surfactin synthase thioesterase subunit